MTHLQQAIETHPVLGLILSVCGVILGALIETLNALQGVHIPPIFLELLQCLSYMGAILVASITVYTFVKKHFKYE